MGQIQPVKEGGGWNFGTLMLFVFLDL